ncbi:MAG: hypothetical protein JSV88_02985 [Candidatus Aminicenantes bacterium]|nr:MAG: hypothetical protein JSV88_02985 [Candidatus Aminicenantes bacterium]
MKKILMVLTLYVFSFVSLSAFGIEGDRPIKNEGINLTSGVDESRDLDAENPKKFPYIGQFVENLKNDGFIVRKGYLEAAFPLLSYEVGVIPSCYYINASAPYMVCALPLPTSSGQTVPNNNIRDFLHNGMWVDFRLRQDEAIVFIGWTPPAEVEYFSYRSYLYNRYLPGEKKFKDIFASLGDTLNNLTIVTTDKFKKPEPFYGSFTIIVTTANKKIYNLISAAAQQANYPIEIINKDVIPLSLVNMGLDKECDTFMFLNRIGPETKKNKKILEDYRNSNPMLVFRLTPGQINPPAPFEVPRLRVRGTGDTKELDLIPALKDLRKAILNKYKDFKATEFKTRIWIGEGYDAIQRGIEAYGEDRDVVYLKSEPFFLNNDPNEFLVIYGVNHAATNKATYSNFSIYGTSHLNGVCGMTNHDFAGSAEKYLPGCKEAKYLYVWKVARRRCCKDHRNCLEVPFYKGIWGIDLSEEAFVGFRAYLEKATKVGPLSTELLYDRVIKFSPHRWWDQDTSIDTNSDKMK